MTPDTTPRHHGPHVDGDQVAIPCLMMRGGSSRGPFFRAEDLPADTATRDAVLLHVMGSPHPLQVDGVGGGHPLTSKVGIVAPSAEAGVDLDFTFAQLQPNDSSVNTSANCGNMLAAALPFALETGLFTATGDTTRAVVRTTNTDLSADIEVLTSGPDHHVAYSGDTAIDGVPGTGSPIRQDFLDTAGSVADSMLPTGQVRDVFALPDGTRLEATCIDNGQPLVIVAASDLGLTGHESVEDLTENTGLKATLEDLRIVASERMGLGDVTHANYPKMTIVAPGGQDADCVLFTTRSFIPHRVHASIGVLAAVTAATAACLPGSVAADVAGNPAPNVGHSATVRVGHPSGSLDVSLTVDGEGTVIRSGILRTARKLMAGEVFVPLSTWDPREPDTTGVKQ